MTEYTREDLDSGADGPIAIDGTEHPTIKYVRVDGYFRISSEIDKFQAYMPFRGLDFDYRAQADIALGYYFIELDVYVVEDDDHPMTITYLDDASMPDWALGWYNRDVIIEDGPQKYVILDMTQVTDKASKRGFRKNSRKWVNMTTGEYGTVSGFYGVEPEV